MQYEEKILEELGYISCVWKNSRECMAIIQKTDGKRSAKTGGLLKKTEDAPYRPVLEYMKAYEVKLEQEIIRYSAAFR